MADGNQGVRTERDSMGEMEVPADALWGASTQRAVLNFPISGERFPRRFIQALGLLKLGAAVANRELGVVDPGLVRWIEAAAREGASGELDDHFVVDVFQTGSGTSTNMNANEVIANRAMQLRAIPEAPHGAAGPTHGAAGPTIHPNIHPNDHVNASQSSNDVIPSALHVAARLALVFDLRPVLERLHGVLVEKARAFDDVVKIGRTHLMDATPVRLGQECAGWARQVERARDRLDEAAAGLAELALGGTAVGTGLNCPPGFARRVLAELDSLTALAWREAADHFEAQGARDAAVQASAALRGLAVALFKIANDVRLLGSGPRCGLGELRLPAIQPGSSIMPGKVNPVICESVTQVAAQVVGNDAAVAVGGMNGHLELNVFVPLIAHNLLGSIRLLAAVSDVFVEKCLRGVEPDRERAAALIEQSLALATALAPRIGYDAAAAIAKQAFAEGRTVRAVARERAVLPDAELDRLLDPRRQTGP
jgi:fumarate hydratase class II